MTARLFHYRLTPGDSDHLPAYYFSEGIVEGELDEIQAIVDDVEGRHYGLLRVTPVEERPQNLVQFRESVGSAIGTYHRIDEEQVCDEDVAYGVDPLDDLVVFEPDSEPD